MPAEDLNMDELTETRRRAIAESIHTITVEELKALGEGLFPWTEHPWRQKFFDFLDEHAGSTFYHATTDDRVHVIYCHAAEKGMWFIPGSGMGPMQAKGLAALKRIVESAP